MLRYSLATLVGVALGTTGFAQTKAPKELPGLLNNNPGQVVSNAVPLPQEVPSKMVHTSAKFSDAVHAGTSTCADPVACKPACNTPACPTTAKKSKSSVFNCFKDLFSFKSTETPCECRPFPTPYQPPLIAYFPCKGKIPFSPNLGGAGGCGDHGCSAPVHVPATPVVDPVPVAPAPTSIPTQKSVPPMTPTISSSLKPNLPATTTLAPSVKPLSLYSPGGVKTTAMQKSEPSPAITAPTTPVSGYKRLGGPKPEPVTSNSLYPWK